MNARLTRITAVGLAVILFPFAAIASDACEAAYVSAQKQAKAHKLLAAKATAKECLKSTCSNTVRDDCSQTLADVNARVPTVVFAATVDGATTTNVTVSVEGAVVATKLDGIPVEMDPGAYTFVFTTADGRSTKVEQAIYESKKLQEVRATFASATPATTPAKPTSSEPPLSSDPAASTPSAAPSAPPKVADADVDAGAGRRTAGLVVGGVGIAAGVTGLLLYLGGSSKQKNLGSCDYSNDPPTCKSDDDVATYNSGKSQKIAGGALLVGGAALFGAGVVLFVTAPSSDKGADKSAARLRVQVGLGSIALGGSF